MDKNGCIAGIPRVCGKFKVIVTATNKYGSDTKVFTNFIIESKPIFLDDRRLSDATIGMPYVRVLKMSGTQPIKLYPASGDIPKGLTLATKKLYGRPSEIRTIEEEPFIFTVLAVNTIEQEDGTKRKEERRT